MLNAQLTIVAPVAQQHRQALKVVDVMPIGAYVRTDL
jgi:hypothetical protein